MSDLVKRLRSITVLVGKSDHVDGLLDEAANEIERLTNIASTADARFEFYRNRVIESGIQIERLTAELAKRATTIGELNVSRSSLEVEVAALREKATDYLNAKRTAEDSELHTAQELDEVAAERDALRADYAKLQELVTSQGTRLMDSEADAERYRWLREKRDSGEGYPSAPWPVRIILNPLPELSPIWAKELDVAIDSARKP